MPSIPAHEFPANLPWLNVTRALRLADLRGKVVLLDFWTYGCINCMHVLADLRRLEAKFGAKLAVIGVHSPKFQNEKNLDCVAQAVRRHGISHPVVHDVGLTLWKEYDVRAWPTLVLIDPEGKVRRSVEGEGQGRVLEAAIGRLIEQFAGSLDDRALPSSPLVQPDLMLRSPGKIAVSDRYVAIADTGHHQVRIASISGRLLRTIGTGEPGLADGGPDTARFHSPQGLAFAGDLLFVADTGNHALRSISLETGDVATIAARGDATGLTIRGPFPISANGLASPWDLTYHRGALYVANAGTHQVWALNFSTATLRPYAGSGSEGLDDGSLAHASFSQPSGICVADERLHIADAEGSAIRRIDLPGSDRVETLVGIDLFDFGDIDGHLDQARLQHPLGVAALAPERLVVADTYNHKLKLIDLQAGSVTTLAGTGRPGSGIGPAHLAAMNEPGGLAVCGGAVLVADTNNHRIVRYDPDNKTLEEWPLRP